MTLLFIYFPVASTFYDGLRNPPRGYLDLALTMNASTAGLCSKFRCLRHCLHSLRVLGWRLFTPNGAVIGEWVGLPAVWAT
ncbi:MAG: hypothetical protein CM1200mP18_17800 [Gammaproteobacteria bacterium]|nr:MAG: hypothetical protein CM1200mP18_17800 [Gammaproteobacteria bacterium]